MVNFIYHGCLLDAARTSTSGARVCGIAWVFFFSSSLLESKAHGLSESLTLREDLLLGMDMNIPMSFFEPL